MRILVTGSRDWHSQDTIRMALEEVRRGHHRPVLLHGDCPTGADAMADQIWREWGLPVQTFPADWKKHGRAAGPIRNQEMVNTGPDVCLAFPKGASRGTRGCIRMARKAGIEVRTWER